MEVNDISGGVHTRWTMWNLLLWLRDNKKEGTCEWVLR